MINGLNSISVMCDRDSLKIVMSGANLVYAAALKQVPSCEFYPLEAIKTNIIERKMF